MPAKKETYHSLLSTCDVLSDIIAPIREKDEHIHIYAGKAWERGWVALLI